jgi:protein-tyrosine phosphatase
MSEVLFVCTGNICRSPAAAGLLRRRVPHDGPDGVTTTSAGTLGATGDPPQLLVEEGAAFGLDLSGHRPRRVEADDVRRAGLVIGMAREHVREVVLMDKTSFTKTFTLREIVRRGCEVGPRPVDEPLDEWLLRAHDGRRHVDLIGDSAQDDIADPMGGSSEDYRRMLTDVDALTGALHSLIWG